MQLRFYVQRAIPARGSSRSLEPLEFHNSMRPTSSAIDPSAPARVLRSARPAGTRVAVGPVEIGGPAFVVVAGPCAVEARRAGETTAEAVARPVPACFAAGSTSRAPARTPSRGWASPGCRILNARPSPRAAGGGRGDGDVPDGGDDDHVGVLQVGARNMQNFALLKALGKHARAGAAQARHRGDGGGVAARGRVPARRAATPTSCSASAASAPSRQHALHVRPRPASLAKSRSHLPVLVDPSHATGIPELVEPMSFAAAAAGADGVMVEVHPRPAEALSDGAQALTPELFAI